MSPGPDRGRPRRESGPSVNNPSPDRKLAARVAETTDSTLRDALALTAEPAFLLGYESGYAAGCAHGRGQFAVGRRQAIEEMAERWAEVARQVRRAAGEPDYRELQRRRGLPDPGPARPVPSPEACRASWEPSPREVAA